MMRITGLIVMGSLLSTLGCGEESPAVEEPREPRIQLLPTPAPAPAERSQQKQAQRDLEIARSLNRTMADTVERVLPSVVVIKTEATQYLLDLFGRVLAESNQPVGQGSGVIIHKDGYVITNNHVLQGAQRIQVILQDGQELDASKVGVNAQTDIAVLKIQQKDGEDFPAIEAGDSEAIRVGEMVMAIGSPFSLSSTVTHGMISQKGREEANLPIVDFIQTSAPINPGNSGGPLIDIEGRLIGINTMIRTGGPYSQGNIGIGFAVPSRTALRAAELIIEGVDSNLSYVGIVMRESRYGVFITRVVVDSPADKAGVKAGDLILTAGGKEISSSAAMSSLVRLGHPGDTIEMEIQRGQERLTLSIVTSAMPAQDFVDR